MPERDIHTKKTRETPVRTYAVLVIDNGHIAMVRHRAGTTAGEGVYGFPGGRPMSGETTGRQVARRELAEETGLEAREGDLLEFPGNFVRAILNFNGSGKKPSTMLAFLTTDYSGILGKQSPSEDPEWIAVRRLSSGLYATSPNVLKVMHNGVQFLERRKK